jgi:hypothetical protein
MRPRGIVEGIGGGVIGAVLMYGFALSFRAHGIDCWAVLKCPVFPAAMHPGFDLAPLMAGLVSQLLVGSCWGMLFGMLFVRARVTTTIVAGPLWGLVVWLGMYYAILPAFNMRLYVSTSVPLWAAALHVVFGVGVGVTVAILHANRGPTGDTIHFGTGWSHRPDHG